VFDKNRLIIDKSVTLNEWKEIGRGLSNLEKSVQFFIGDWIRFGNDELGIKYTDPKVYDELVQITGYTRKTLQDYKSISERTSSIRIEDLSFSHHQQVASLPPEQQKKLLMMASKQKLSKNELRQEVKRLKNKPDELDKMSDDGNLTLASLLTIKPKLSKKEQLVQDWVDKVPGNYDEIDMDILMVIIPLVKSLKDKYGIQGLVQLQELISLVKFKDL